MDISKGNDVTTSEAGVCMWSHQSERHKYSSLKDVNCHPIMHHAPLLICIAHTPPGQHPLQVQRGCVVAITQVREQVSMLSVGQDPEWNPEAGWSSDSKNQPEIYHHFTHTDSVKACNQSTAHTPHACTHTYTHTLLAHTYTHTLTHTYCTRSYIHTHLHTHCTRSYTHTLTHT